MTVITSTFNSDFDIICTMCIVWYGYRNTWSSRWPCSSRLPCMVQKKTEKRSTQNLRTVHSNQTWKMRSVSASLPVISCFDTCTSWQKKMTVVMQEKDWEILLYSKKFSSAKNFVKSDRQAVRQEFIFVTRRVARFVFGRSVRLLIVYLHIHD